MDRIEFSHSEVLEGSASRMSLHTIGLRPLISGGMPVNAIFLSKLISISSWLMHSIILTALFLCTILEVSKALMSLDMSSEKQSLSRKLLIRSLGRASSFTRFELEFLA